MYTTKGAYLARCKLMALRAMVDAGGHVTGTHLAGVLAALAVDRTVELLERPGPGGRRGRAAPRQDAAGDRPRSDCR